MPTALEAVMALVINVIDHRRPLFHTIFPQQAACPALLPPPESIATTKPFCHRHIALVRLLTEVNYVRRKREPL